MAPATPATPIITTPTRLPTPSAPPKDLPAAPDEVAAKAVPDGPPEVVRDDPVPMLEREGPLAELDDAEEVMVVDIEVALVIEPDAVAVAVPFDELEALPLAAAKFAACPPPTVEKAVHWDVGPAG